MTTSSKDPVLVVVQLTGGNDFMNTVVPYNNGYYRDARKGGLRIEEEDVLKLDDEFGLHPTLAPLKELYDQGDMAVLQGVGYPNSPRSHFRSMDIWHTCEPDKVGTEGWAGRAVRDLDPQAENPVTGVHIGPGLPRALVVSGVPVASVADLSTYGLLTGVEQEQKRDEMLKRFVNMYGRAIGTGPVNDYLGRTGLDAVKGADILKDGRAKYSSGVEYGTDQISKNLRDIASIHTADLGTRLFYTSHVGFDTHANQGNAGTGAYANLMGTFNDGLAAFYSDLQNQSLLNDTLVLQFSEFGRRINENGSGGSEGTDHGAAGMMMAIGGGVRGGIFGTAASLNPDAGNPALERDGTDVRYETDFRAIYAKVLDGWLGADSVAILGGDFRAGAPAII